MAVKTLVIEFPWNESADDEEWIFRTEEIMHWLRVKFGDPGTAADRKWFSRLHQKIDYFHKDKDKAKYFDLLKENNEISSIISL